MQAASQSTIDCGKDADIDTDGEVNLSKYPDQRCKHYPNGPEDAHRILDATQFPSGCSPETMMPTLPRIDELPVGLRHSDLLDHDFAELPTAKHGPPAKAERQRWQEQKRRSNV